MRRAELLWLVCAACKRQPTQPTVPSTTSPIVIDGAWGEPDWSARALRGVFVRPEGGLARPSSEVRLLHDDRDLLVALYAADEDVETRDVFTLRLGALAFAVDSTGRLSPPIPRVRAAVDLDEGTRDNPRDDDEEWVVELAIPLDLVDLAGGATLDVGRCDTPKDGIERCGAWSAALRIAR